MTDHLPERLSDWPNDAHQLLGVDRDSDLNSLRRAYTRLIRKFKPEHSPDEFQRIREAYDTVRAFAEFKEKHRDSASDWVTPAEPDSDQDQVGLAEPRSEAEDVELADRLDATTDSPANEHSRAPHNKHDDQISEAWELARGGDVTAARSRLEDLHLRMPEDEDVIARLYWIRKLIPSDTSIDLVEWLVGIIRKRGPQGRPWQFLLAEASRNASETLREDIIELARFDSQLERLVPLLLIRWKHSAQIRNWKVIRNDLKLLRDRFLPDDSLPWVKLLVSALQIVVWAEDVLEDLFTKLADEIDQFEELQLRHASMFDQVEELLDLRKELLKAPEFVPPETLNLIRDDVLRLVPDVRWRLLDFASSWKIRPDETLAALDALLKDCPVIFTQLATSMSRLNTAGFNVPVRHEPIVTRSIEQFIDAADWNDVDSARLELFRFCVREALPLRYVVKRFEDCNIPARTAELFREAFQGDAALSCLCEGVTAANSC